MSIPPHHWLKYTTIVVGVLTPLFSLAQVTIKERVEVKTNAPAKLQSSNRQLQLNGANYDFYNPPLFHSDGVLPLWAAVVESGTLDIQGPIDGNQEAVVTVVLFGGYQDRQIAWKGRQPISWGGNMYEGQSPRNDTLSAGSPIPDVQMYLFRGVHWSDGTRAITITDNRVDYSFDGLLYQGGVIVAPVKGTGTVTGSVLANMKFNDWNVMAGDMTVFGRDSEYVSCIPLDGKGDEYAPAGSYPEASMTWRVDAPGDFAYLSYMTYTWDADWNLTITYVSGKQLTVPVGTGVFLVYDARQGSFNGPSATVQVAVTGGGRSKSIAVVLAKGIPCDRVTILPDRIAAGDTAEVKIEKNNGDGTFSAYLPSQTFDAMITGETILGTLVSPDGSGTVVSDVRAPLVYVAPKTFDGTWYSVQISVSTHGSGTVASSPAPAKIVPGVGMPSNQATAQSLDKKQRASVVASLGKHLAENTCPPGSITVEKMVCAQVTINPPTLLPGGTAALSFFIDNGDETTSSFPDGTTFNIRLVASGEGSDPGTIVAANGSGAELMGALAPMTYVAPSTIGGDSLDVLIFFEPVLGGGGGADKAPVGKPPTLSDKLTMSLTGTKEIASKTALREMIGRRLAQSSCPLPKVKVRRPKRIDLTLKPAQLDNGKSNQSILRASLEDRAGAELTGDQSNVTVNYKLGYEGRNYCGLGSGDGPLDLNTSYKDAVGEKVFACRNTITFDEIFPLRVNVTASVLPLLDIEALSIVGPHTTGEYFNQGNGPWADDFYGSSKDSIRKQGCALTTVAMILKALGVDFDPGTLNRKMIKDGLYSGASKNLVDFSSLPKIARESGLSLRKSADVGSGLRRIAEGIVDGPPLPNVLISDALSDEDFAIAEVKSYHPESGKTNKHFVLITGMRGTDPGTGRRVYSVLDPGNSKVTTLEGYSNNVYRLITFHGM